MDKWNPTMDITFFLLSTITGTLVFTKYLRFVSLPLIILDVATASDRVIASTGHIRRADSYDSDSTENGKAFLGPASFPHNLAPGEL
jgi:hypothetical protein